MSVDHLSTADDPQARGAVELGAAASTGFNPTLFFSEIKSVNSDLRQLKKLRRRLAETNESFKLPCQPLYFRYSRGLMNSQIDHALTRAESIKLKLHSLENSDAHRHGIHVSNLFAGMSKKVKPSYESFASLRVGISGDYREAVRRDHATVTGRAPEEGVLNELMASGEAERFLRLVVQEQEGTMGALVMVEAMGERYAAAREIGARLLELEQVLMDALVLVEAIRARVGDDVPSMELGSSSSLAETPHDSSSGPAGCVLVILLLLILGSTVAIVAALA